MDRPGPSFKVDAAGKVNDAFHMMNENMAKSSSSAGGKVASGKATEDRLRVKDDSERRRKGQWVDESFSEDCPADPSAVPALERTLAVYMNQGLGLMGFGTVLMMFGDDDPKLFGIVLVPVGLLYVIWSWCEFYIRIRRMRNGSDNPVSYRRSLVWTGTLVILIMVASIIELFFNISLGAFTRVIFPDTNGQGVPSTTTHA